MPRWMVVFLSLGVIASSGLPVHAEEAKKEETGKVVYTFKDEDELKQFTQMFIAKQNVLTRVAVLGQYMSLEQENLKQINGQLFLQYKVDPEKNYTLDGEKRALMERPAAPPAATPAVPAVKP